MKSPVFNRLISIFFLMGVLFVKLYFLNLTARGIEFTYFPLGILYRLAALSLRSFSWKVATLILSPLP